jgi:3-oxoacyl-[acyl-carrier-protein] synthase II
MSTNHRVVITGMGVVNPAGIGLTQFWETITSETSALQRITRFDPEAFPVQVAGEINTFQANDFMPRRFVVKTDRFTHFALAASEMALQDAALDLLQQDRYRVGVFFGNNAGGWDICERGFFELHQQGARMVNPWQATAWFPTAAQGFVTIRYGIKGFSKSFVCDRASGASGLYFGIQSIKNRHNDIVLSGGTEAPITRFGMTCYFETGELAPAKEADGAYRPFDRERSGVVLGEGSAVLVLEERDFAQQRGAQIYGEVLGCAMTTDPLPTEYSGLVRAMQRTLRNASIEPADVDLIIAEGCGTVVSDYVEARAIKEVFGACAPEIPVTSPKSIYGHLYGASSATELVCGLLAMKTGVLPPTLNCTMPDPECALHLVTHAEQQSVSRVLVNARSREGVNICLLIGKS